MELLIEPEEYDNVVELKDDVILVECNTDGCEAVQGIKTTWEITRCDECGVMDSIYIRE